MTFIQGVRGLFSPLKQIFRPSEPKQPILSIGDKAPDFDLPATGQQGRIKLSQLTQSGKNVLLVFYPMDNTPGCTIQLCSLRNDYEQFANKNTVVLGINPGSLKSHEGFVKSQNLPFPIVVDQGKQMAKSYGVLGALGFVDRSVFLIDKNNTIRLVVEGTQNNKEVLAEIDKLNA